MRKKLSAAVASRVSLLAYLAGAGTVSLGGALIYLPAGVITGGLFLIGLVVIDDGR